MIARGVIAGFGLAAVAAGGVPPQQPAIQHAKVDVRTATAVDREVAAVGAGDEPVWVGWREPAVDGVRDMCCLRIDDASVLSSNTSRGCAIDPAPGDATPVFTPPNGAVALESGTGLVLLVRVTAHHVERLRTLSDDCPIDGGGRTVVWMDGATPESSIAFLQSLTAQTDGTLTNRRTLADAAIAAIALHRGTAAAGALTSLARTDDAHIRAQALRALGRHGDPHAAATLSDALDHDTDVEAQRGAVAGLAQLPADVSIPKLIDVASSSRPLPVRQEAMNWLARSKDPRVVAFFERLLGK